MCPCEYIKLSARRQAPLARPVIEQCGKMVAVTFALLSLVALTSVYTYEFDDPHYNDLLSEDLDDGYLQLTKRSAHPRVRREESEEEDDKCHHRWGRRNKNLCCGEELVKKFMKEKRELKRECFKEVMAKDGGEPPKDPFSCEEAEKRKKHVVCAMQCVGQKRNMLDEDGNPKTDEIKKFLEESTFSEAPWFKEKQEEIITKCLADVETAKAKQDSSEGSCNPAGIVLTHCFFREFQLSCPESEIKNQETCDKFKERVKDKKMDFFGQSQSSED